MVRPTLLFLFALLGVAWSQSSDDVAREVQRLKTQVDEERRAISTDSSRQAEWRSQSLARVGSMRDDSRRLVRERDSLRQALDRESKPKPPPPVPVAPATLRKKAFAQALAREVDRTIPLLAAELDGGTELKERWTVLANGLRSGSENPEDALGTFLDELSERIDLGSRIQARAGNRTDASGRVVRGTWIDVGASLQVFSGRDGSAALKSPSGTREVANPALSSAIARSAKVLSGEDPPGWVRLPIGPEAGK